MFRVEGWYLKKYWKNNVSWIGVNRCSGSGSYLITHLIDSFDLTRQAAKDKQQTFRSHSS